MADDAPLFDPALLEDALDRSSRYLAGLGERRVAPDADQTAAASVALGGALPELGTDPAEVLRLLDEYGSPSTVASAGPRYFGFVTGGVLPAALATNWLAAAWDQNAFSRVSSPIGSILEGIAEEWLVALLGLPAGTAASFVSGATMANVTGLVSARTALLAELDWSVEEQGMFGAPPIQVVVGGEVHASMRKALAFSGFGRERVVRVPVDDQGRMRADMLPTLKAPAIVCLQAGNVNTGAFDPAHEIIPALSGPGVWFHVDGAFGLWAAAAPERAHLVAGYEDADSWAVDGHKWLNVPYDSGIALVRDRTAVVRANTIRATYLPDDPADRDPYDYTPEASRRPRGMEIWAALRSLGQSGLEDLVERCCRHAARFAAGLEAAGYEVLNEVCLNQVLVSFGTPQRTLTVIEGVQREGTCWAGGTEWQGRTAMRISVSGWSTTTEDVDRSLEAILRIASVTPLAEED
ncbi:MAG: pyridoxal phosphate-dependent decarboxylase family protein [Longimicrobiales bacterium]